MSVKIIIHLFLFAEVYQQNLSYSFYGWLDEMSACYVGRDLFDMSIRKSIFDSIRFFIPTSGRTALNNFVHSAFSFSFIFPL